MKAISVIQECLNIGITLSVNEKGNLSYKTLTGKIPKSVLDTLKFFKTDIVDFLKTSSNENRLMVSPSSGGGTILTSKDWLEVLNYIIDSPCPTNFPKQQWEILINELSKLVSSECPHISQFIKNNYSIKEVLSCHPLEPYKRYDYMGIVLLLNSTRHIKKILEDKVIFQTSGGSIQTLMRNNLKFPDNTVTLLDLKLPHSIFFTELSHYQSHTQELWHAMNEIVLDFMAKTGHDQESSEILVFINEMTDYYAKNGLYL